MGNSQAPPLFHPLMPLPPHTNQTDHFHVLKASLAVLGSRPALLPGEPEMQIITNPVELQLYDNFICSSRGIITIMETADEL